MHYAIQQSTDVQSSYTTCDVGYSALNLCVVPPWDARSERTGLSARGRPARCRPSRRWRPPRRGRRSSGRTRSRGSPACTDRAECTRLPPRRTSRKRASACRPSYDTSDCPLSAISCRPCSAVVDRSSFL